MVIATRKRGREFCWVGAGGFYGENPAFLRSLDNMGEVFVADVHKNQRIYIKNPEPKAPSPSSKKGRKPTLLKAQKEPVRVDQWVVAQPNETWKSVILRDTTKSKLKVDILHKQVWVWDGEEPEAKLWHLIVMCDLKDKKTMNILF